MGEVNPNLCFEPHSDRTLHQSSATNAYDSITIRGSGSNTTDKVQFISTRTVCHVAVNVSLPPAHLLFQRIVSYPMKCVDAWP